MKHALAVISSCAAILALAPAAPVRSATAPAGGRVFALSMQNGSGEHGTFALKPRGAKTTIEIHLLGAPHGLPQPAHLHLGSCAKLNPAPLIALTSPVDGISETSIDMPMAKLLTRGLALNVHKSATEITTYVACGDIAP